MVSGRFQHQLVPGIAVPALQSLQLSHCEKLVEDVGVNDAGKVLVPVHSILCHTADAVRAQIDAYRTEFDQPRARQAAGAAAGPAPFITSRLVGAFAPVLQKGPGITYVKSYKACNPNQPDGSKKFTPSVIRTIREKAEEKVDGVSPAASSPGAITCRA
jgi:hypothetical protein